MSDNIIKNKFKDTKVKEIKKDHLIWDSKTVDGIPCIDVSNPEYGVEVTICDGKLWVNVDGICMFRVYGSPMIEVNER